MRARATSATLIVIGTLLATFIGGWVFFVAALGVSLLALEELLAMLNRAGHHPARLLAHLLTIVFFLIALAGGDARWLGEALTLAVVGPLLTVMLRRNLRGTMLDWAVSVAATLYIGWLAAHAVLLRNPGGQPLLASFLVTDLPVIFGRLEFNPPMLWTLTAILVTWATDTAAFAGGRVWGRRRLMPLLSPKKTWEGATTGTLAGTATTVACVFVYGLPLAWPVAIGAGIALSVIAQLGDLAESLLKRQTGVKDAGTAIPGHGGVLDRIDSLLFTLPATYYLATFV